MIGVYRDRLRDVRVKSGYSQRQFAIKSGLSQSLISAIESGDRRPAPQTALKICEVLSVEWDNLFFTIGVYK